jgi:hypothetical protein
MRRALVVGIGYYKSYPKLQGSVVDAEAIANLLMWNGDGTKNCDVRLECATGPRSSMTRRKLADLVGELFNGSDAETAVFYYAGHGALAGPGGGFLVTSECSNSFEGLAWSEVVGLANQSLARDKVLIVDTCLSGAVGTRVTEGSKEELAEGVTILAASTEGQEAGEDSGVGSFTTFLCDALQGTAANLIGEVSPASVFAHIDQNLGPWGQRPAFKTNVKRFVSLRKVKSQITIEDLRQLPKIFRRPTDEYSLDPSYEPTSEVARKGNVARFALLQRYARVNLVVPIETEHLYFAAMNSKACRLTALGRHYWRLVNSKRLRSTSPASSE